MPNGFRNSSCRISPGWTGGSLDARVLRVIVCDLDVIGVPLLPAETDSPLVVDPDTVPSLTIARELRQPIYWWDAEIFQRFGGIEHSQFPLSNTLNSWAELPGTCAKKRPLRFFVPEGSDHLPIIT